MNALKYQGYDESQWDDLSAGLRFYPAVCAVLMGIATFLNSAGFMALIAVVAVLSVILPNHPLDYLWNGVISKLTSKAPVPPSTLQRKVACAIAVVGLGIASWAFFAGITWLGELIGYALTAAATLKAMTHYCPVSQMVFFTLKKRN